MPPNTRITLLKGNARVEELDGQKHLTLFMDPNEDTMEWQYRIEQTNPLNPAHLPDFRPLGAPCASREAPSAVLALSFPAGVRCACGRFKCRTRL